MPQNAFTRRARPLAGAAGAVVLAASLAGCQAEDVRTLGWEFVFAEPAVAVRAVVVEGRILVGGCGSSATFYRAEVARGETPASPPRLAAGTYGFEGTARDGACLVIASGCNG